MGRKHSTETEEDAQKRRQKVEGSTPRNMKSLAKAIAERVRKHVTETGIIFAKATTEIVRKHNTET
jgi:hypothetical protein